MLGVDSILVAAALHGSPALPANSATFAAPTFLVSFPCSGSDASTNESYGVCTDGAFVYDADYLGSRVLKFDTNGNLLSEWTPPPPSPGQYFFPHGIAVAPTGEVFVSEDQLYRIDVFSSAGVRLRSFGGFGSSLGELNAPTYLCATPEGTLLVADSQNQRIQEFTFDGTPIRAWGGPGSLGGQFAGPRGVAMDAAEEIIVVDEGNARVEVFSRTGTFLRQWAVPFRIYVDGFSPVPRGVAVDGLGRIYVTDVTNGRVDVFQTDGTLLGLWGSDPGPGQMIGPNAISVDPTGRIYVAGKNCHVQEFARDGATVVQRQSWGGVKITYR